MPNQVQIREYKAEDLNSVLNLIRLNTPIYFAPEEEAHFIDYLASKKELYYVLLYDGKIVGAGGVNFAINKSIGMLSWGMIHPEYQKMAFGKKLLQHRIEVLNSINTIQKITVRTSQKVYKFFEKQGFELAEVNKDYWAKGLDLYYMIYKKI